MPRAMLFSEAKNWERKLALLADGHCRAIALSKGQELSSRLLPVFNAVDEYVLRAGDLSSIFDREAEYFSQAGNENRKAADRLAFSVSYVRADSEDIRLACLLLLQHAFEVEGSPNTLFNVRVNENNELRSRIYLLTDYVRERRAAFVEVDR